MRNQLKILLITVFVSTCILAAVHSQPLVLTRFPYLQEMTSHSVVVAWRTNLPVQGELTVQARASLDARSTNIQETAEVQHHHLLIDHLSPNTDYQYQILNHGNPLTDWIRFKTFPEGGNAQFSFAVLGDSGTASVYQKQVAEQMAKHHPDFVLHTGDVIYHAKSDTDFDLKFFSIYRLLAEHVPFFPTLGNHDTAFHGGQPYLENFYLPQNSPGQGRYYSFTCAQAHFDALDSNEPIGPGSPQYAWFKQDLKNSKEPVKIVYFHHPPYSSGFHGSTLKIRKALAPLFKQFHVVLVFNGHDHDYERTIPMDGTTYIVTGGGGARLYPALESPWTAYTETVYDFVLCKINGKKIHCEAINNQGKIFDQDDVVGD